MSKVIKAEVIQGRYKGEIVRITNISRAENGKENAACILTNGQRANIPLSDLKIIPETSEPLPTVRRAKTASMPFISGSSSSRTLTHTKNMNKNRVEIKSDIPSQKYCAALCEICGTEYNLEDRRGLAGKITVCPSCSSDE